MLLLLFVTAVFFVYLLVWRRLSFWERKGVKYAKTRSILGNISDNFLQKRAMADIMSDLYNGFPDEPFFGIFTMLTPTLVIRDPELIKELAVKNSDVFLLHKLFSTGDQAQAFTKNLFQANSHIWRTIRPSLSPAFTGSKMRGLFELMTKCSKQCVESLLKTTTTEEIIVVDAKSDLFIRFCIDAIATCIFGLESNSFVNRDNEFFVRGAEVVDFGGLKIFSSFGYCLNKCIANILKLRTIPVEDEAFFSRVVLENIKLRKEQSITRPDMVHLLMQAQQGKLKHEVENTLDDTGFATIRESSMGKKNSTIQISDLDVVGHSLLFLVAGSDTPALALNLMSYELATNKNVQDRLYEELRNAKEDCNGKMTYEKLMSLKYLDMVCSETLRKWPPFPVTDRVATRPYTINHNGRSVHLEEGSIIWLPIMCIHRDPKYYPDPEKFDPERFSDENKDKLNKDHYMPFGIGPRACIGSRMAMLMLKSVMFHILDDFEMLPVKETPNQLELSKKHFFLNSDTPVYVGLKQRQKLE